MFVDQIRIHAKAGDGGSGCCSFRREKFVPRGGPDGGNGGRGGDIILEADQHTDNLVSLFYEPMIRAESGNNGQGKDKHGRNAHPKIVRLPLGTVIYRLPAPPSFPEETPTESSPQKAKPNLSTLEVVGELVHENQRVVLCAGGDGGKGNAHFKSSTNRAPRHFTPGFPGEEGWFVLELRTIAFAGLVGYPNAGKSTLLGSISAAHPKIASYPFTTLRPFVGVVELPGYKRITVADIPGLIQGAHANKGLGHEFLRHIVRCKMLLFVIDMAGSEGRNPLEDFQTLRKELKLYDPTLSSKPWAIVANKMDLPEAASNLEIFKSEIQKATIIPAAVSSGQGVELIKSLLAESQEAYEESQSE